MKGKNQHVARILRETALLLEVHGPCGESRGGWIGRCRSYGRAAEVVASLMEPVEQLAMDPVRLTALSGIGKRMDGHIREIIETGDYSLHKELLATYPETILDLLEIPSLGPRRVRLLWRKFRAATLGRVEELARAGRLRGLDGFGEKSEANLLAAIAEVKKALAERRMLDFPGGVTASEHPAPMEAR